jgi:hypothetical protein
MHGSFSIVTGVSQRLLLILTGDGCLRQLKKEIIVVHGNPKYFNFRIKTSNNDQRIILNNRIRQFLNGISMINTCCTNPPIYNEPHVKTQGFVLYVRN